MPRRTLARPGLVLLAMCLALTVATLSLQHRVATAAVTYQVNTATDTNDGACDVAHCSLREAIIAANTSAGADVIEFALAGSQTITAAPMPLITDTVHIDGTTAGGYAGIPLIEVKGGGTVTNGFEFRDGSAGSRLSALVINGFSSNMVVLWDDNITIDANYIGTNATGTAGASPMNGYGVQMVSPTNGNIIEDNLISGVGNAITGDHANNSIISGNKIGTNAAGTAAIGNGVGISIFESSFLQITGNLISASQSAGLSISAGTSLPPAQDITIQGNFVGTNVTGTAPLPNNWGMLIGGVGSNVHIGGPLPLGPMGGCTGPCNLVSGNLEEGIRISAELQPLIEGNFVGTNATGTNAIANGVTGVVVTDVFPGSGNSTVRDNLISGNGQGLHVQGGAHFIHDNLIGVAADGSTPLGNISGGVLVHGNFEAAAAQIGNAGANVIAHTTQGDGVVVRGSSIATVRNNLIHSNNLRGIDNLFGGNGELPPPVFTSLTLAGVAGTACPNCIVDVYSDSVDEGRVFEGTATADGAGAWSLVATLDGPCVNAIATSGALTSEFGGSPNFDEIIDLTPPKAFDDVTVPNSDFLSDACDTDDDNDGRSDADEIGGVGCAAAITDPFDADSDGDLYIDSAECVLGTDPNDVASKPALAFCGAPGDGDADGVLSQREVCFYNTNPALANTDGDLCPDGKEVASINNDFAVNVIDLSQIAGEFGIYTLPGSPVEANFDVTKDGAINVIDLQLVAARFGTCP